MRCRICPAVNDEHCPKCHAVHDATCNECGAVVADLEHHLNWHRGDVLLEPNAKRMVQWLWRNRHKHEPEQVNTEVVNQ